MSDMKKHQSNSDDVIATLESTGAHIFKAPESPPDAVVTGSALIAVAIVATYLVRLFRGKR